MTLPLAISTGDPGGIGPEIAARAMADLGHEDCALLFGDSQALAAHLQAAGLGERCRKRAPGTGDGAWGSLTPGELGLVHVAEWSPEACVHAPSVAGGRAQLAALSAASQAALAGRARALVTAPMSKAAVNLAGHPFRGHTEYLAERAGLADDAVSMMFLGPRLRVGLVTTHLAIADVPTAITQARVERTIMHTGEAIFRLARGAKRPQILVAGLNPHAGEGGLFGQQEARVVEPAMVACRERPPFVHGQVALVGPLGAETAFRMAADAPSRAVVAMMHDQATIASKLLDWGEAVNVTWGLPFVRTSVDHGVAYDAARDGCAEADGMRAALRMAQRLTA